MSHNRLITDTDRLRMIHAVGTMTEEQQDIAGDLMAEVCGPLPCPTFKEFCDGLDACIIRFPEFLK